jgi:hypothetical protein
MTEFPIIRKRVLAYVLARGGAKDIGASDLAFSVARQYNQWVTDSIAHKYWCVIFDLDKEGLIQIDKEY